MDPSTSSAMIAPATIESSPPRRHDGRVGRVSSDPALLRRLDLLIVGEGDVRTVVDVVCRTMSVPSPKLKFHARRSPFTGACEAPRGQADERLLVAGRARGRTSTAASEHGALRLGRTITLMTLAHELGHHLVNHLDRKGTPAHGMVWVGRFDEAAGIIASMVPSEQQ